MGLSHLQNSFIYLLSKVLQPPMGDRRMRACESKNTQRAVCQQHSMLQQQPQKTQFASIYIKINKVQVGV